MSTDCAFARGVVGYLQVVMKCDKRCRVLSDSNDKLQAYSGHFQAELKCGKCCRVLSNSNEM